MGTQGKQRHCARCGEGFPAVTQKKFCSKACYDAERAEKRRAAWREDRGAARYEIVRNSHGSEIARRFARATKCSVCGLEREGHYSQLHHVKPKSEGGGNTVDNILPLCYYCHKDIHHVGRGIVYLERKYNWSLDSIK